MITEDNTLRSVKLRLDGLSPLLQHSARLADPLDPIAKDIKEISSKRKKTDADHMQMAKLEWKGSLYINDDQKVVLPAESIKAALIGGAKKERNGPQARGGTFIFETPVLQHDESQKDIDGLWGKGESRNVHRASVKVTTSRITRTRPQFHNWSADVLIHYDTTQAHESDVVRWLETAGRIIGIGDWRPEKSGVYGRFTVKVI
ncbi:MAG: hypothetical protein OEU36_20365 [Gammaproteobacteria bacterium]|nr:hypothetical protein [Gammaproteobacteria bacterium]